jgi:hypothetical protein
MTTTQSETSGTYYIQPMTGTVHTDRACSVGTARYRLSRAVGTDAEILAHIARGALKSCKKCGPR